MPAPENCRMIEGPEGPGVYQIRNSLTKQNIQFGISKTCRARMKSFFPQPHGTGTRKNKNKREYILSNWMCLEYRTMETESRHGAKTIEDNLKAQKNHLFNT
ncbi:MAG TPA: hypothetical protein VHE59_04195 [Mucilaginibacter sp.]|nr:hypothetical protein [Mucilaginibacter sp.]